MKKLILFLLLFVSNTAFAASPQDILSLTNQLRQTNNLPVLKANSCLTQAAQAKLNDMLAKNYFAHETPEGHPFSVFTVAAKYQYLIAGENLAKGYGSAGEIMTAFMNSPTHKANILGLNYKDIGIAVGTVEWQGKQVPLVVQEFGQLQAKARGCRK